MDGHLSLSLSLPPQKNCRNIEKADVCWDIYGWFVKWFKNMKTVRTKKCTKRPITSRRFRILLSSLHTLRLHPKVSLNCLLWFPDRMTHWLISRIYFIMTHWLAHWCFLSSISCLSNLRVRWRGEEFFFSFLNFFFGGEGRRKRMKKVKMRNVHEERDSSIDWIQPRTKPSMLASRTDRCRWAGCSRSRASGFPPRLNRSANRPRLAAGGGKQRRRDWELTLSFPSIREDLESTTPS